MKLIKLLENEGFMIHRSSGSHHISKHSSGKGVVVPLPKKDLPKGAFHAILKQA